MIVQTNYGLIRGLQEGDLYVFRGIPYAQPPTEERRFTPPCPPLPWEGVFHADHFGPVSYQPVLPQRNLGEQSEDCLRLNIWTPGVDTSLRPVLVDIHGGGFTTGTGAHSNYFTFAEQDDIVCVSFNYRVGALGFLYLGDLLGESYQTSGNNGLLDIVAALQWVKENIQHFGGDPNRITVSGRSAGAKCACTLLTVPAAQGLFHQLIAQSGATQSIRDKHTANQITLRFLDRLGISSENAHQILTLPAQTIVDAQDNSLHTFGPVHDGITLCDDSIANILSKADHKIPILLGTNSDEAALLTQSVPRMKQPSEELMQSFFGLNSDYVWSAYHDAALLKSPEDAWKDVLTEYLYHKAAVRLAEVAARQDWPVWLYRFNFSNGFGAFHGLESSFVSNSSNEPSDSASALFKVPPRGKQLASCMHAAWAAFIHSGQPKADNLLYWPNFNKEERSVMIFDEECKLQREPELTDNTFPDQVIRL